MQWEYTSAMWHKNQGSCRNLYQKMNVHKISEQLCPSPETNKYVLSKTIMQVKFIPYLVNNDLFCASYLPFNMLQKTSVGSQSEPRHPHQQLLLIKEI
jgi:hypothetical protein